MKTYLYEVIWTLRWSVMAGDGFNCQKLKCKASTTQDCLMYKQSYKRNSYLLNNPRAPKIYDNVLKGKSWNIYFLKMHKIIKYWNTTYCSFVHLNYNHCARDQTVPLRLGRGPWSGPNFNKTGTCTSLRTNFFPNQDWDQVRDQILSCAKTGTITETMAKTKNNTYFLKFDQKCWFNIIKIWDRDRFGDWDRNQ